MREIIIHATHTKVAVNYGEHAQDIHVARAVDEHTTLGALIRGTLASFPYGENDPVFEHEDYLIIKVAKPAHTPKERS